MHNELVLSVRDIGVRFGGLVAVDSVSFTVGRGSIVGLVGPNGAGKTTLFNAISGLVPTSHGEIELATADGAIELTKLPASRRARAGIGRTFQDSRLAADLPVIDQLCTGALATRGRIRGFFSRSPGFLAAERDLAERAHTVMESLGIEKYSATDLDLLSAPVRRLVDLGRALMCEPRLLLLDEISAGMPPEDKRAVADLVLQRVAEQGISVVLVEHDMSFVRYLADHVVVVAEGKVLAEGEPDEVLTRADVLEAYIGTSAQEVAR